MTARQWTWTRIAATAVGADWATVAHAARIMAWRRLPNRCDTHTLPEMRHPAVRALVTALLMARCRLLDGVGSATLPGGQQLLGFADTAGDRDYLLVDGATATHVLSCRTAATEVTR